MTKIRWHTLKRRAPGLVSWCTLTLLAVGIAPLHASAGGRVVAVGDVHGAYGPLVQILHATGVVDQNLRWSGGSTILVQTGDLVERGPEVRAVLDLMIDLQQQAEEAGGRVVVLLGNHDVTTLFSYLDYKSTPPPVYRRIFSDFSDGKSEDRRRQAFKQWTRWRTRFPNCGSQSRAEWEESHPPGFVEYFEALSPEGRYGAWLRSLPAVTRIGTTLFSHAGPSPWLVDRGLTSIYEINRAISREIETFDRARAFLLEEGTILPFFTLSEIYCAVTEELIRTPHTSRPAKYYVPLTAEQRRRFTEIRENLPSVENSLTLRKEGPLWYRGYAKLDANGGRRMSEKIAKAFGVDNLVVAHSTVKGSIRRRFDRVYFIDTGMVYSGSSGGRPAALEISADGFTARYPEEATRLARGPVGPITGHDPDTSTALRLGWKGVDGTALPLRDQGEVEEFLRSARIIADESLRDAPDDSRKLLLEQYGMRAHAVFRSIDTEERNKRLSNGDVVRFFTDSYRNEIAAYRLARLLEMRGVHPTVERRVDGADGSLQLWFEDVMSERERTNRNLHPADREAWRRQIGDLRVFDNLINNFGRSKSTILVDAGWRVWLVDHSRSFGLEPELPDPQYVESCSRALWDRIESLDRSHVVRKLGDVLRDAEIEALFERRNALLDLVRTRIARTGEEEFFGERLVGSGTTPQVGENPTVDPSY